MAAHLFRHKYNPHDSTLAIRMPSIMRDFLTEKLVKGTERQIEAYITTCSLSSSTILVFSKTPPVTSSNHNDNRLAELHRRSPNTASYHSTVQYPGVGIQKKLADGYIMMLNANIKMVV